MSRMEEWSAGTTLLYEIGVLGALLRNIKKGTLSQSQVVECIDTVIEDLCATYTKLYPAEGED